MIAPPMRRAIGWRRCRWARSGSRAPTVEFGRRCAAATRVGRVRPTKRRSKCASANWPRDPLRERIERAKFESGEFESGWCFLDPATRRRMRFNGVAHADGPDTLRVEAHQVYSNCPKYIQQRARAELFPLVSAPAQATTGHVLTTTQSAALTKCDTLFWATLGPDGADCSHRGGNPGWLRVEGQTLRWNDYPGNAMFNTLGNLEHEARCAIVALDWENHIARQLCGHARVLWQGEARIVEFDVEFWRESRTPVLAGWRLQEMSPFNPE